MFSVACSLDLLDLVGSIIVLLLVGFRYAFSFYYFV